MAIAYFCDHCGAEIAPEDTICPVCQQPLATSAAFAANGALLNERYALISEVGAGGFGAVYKARDAREHDRLVAVKQINLQGLSSQEIIEATDAFNREAEILTTLNHPLLPTIFDRFSDPEHWYLVMTYIDGTTLDEYLQQHRVSGSAISAGLPLGETLEIALRLCGALHYLHSQQPPVIFRDLKPGNIMRTRKGQLYLIDFGIARRFKPGQAKDTIPFGSPGFAAPEQYGRAQTTPQADIYSLGALLYCLITGDDPSEHPFDFPSLHHYAITGTRELNALIQRMVSPDPISRPANIQVVQAEFRRIQDINTKANQQGRIWTPPQGQTPPANGSGQQHIFLNPTLAKQQQARKTTRRAVITTALVLGGVAAFGGIAALASQPHGPVVGTYQSSSATQVTPDAQNPQPTPTATQEDTATPPITGPRSWSPDLSHSAAVDDSGKVYLYRNQEQNPFQTIQPPFDSSYVSVTGVQWSPDNQRILIFVDNHTNSGGMWNVANGQQLSLLPLTLTSLSSLLMAVWSPDSQYLALSYPDPSNVSTFALFDALHGKQLYKHGFSEQAATSLAWTPDSQSVLFPIPSNSQAISSSWIIEIWNSRTYQQTGTIASANASDFDTMLNTISSLSVSPLTDQIAFIYQGDIWLGKMNNSKSIRQLTTNGLTFLDSGSGLFWSPSEKYLALFSNNAISIYDAFNGSSVPLNNNAPQSNIVAFTWSSDSQSITVVDSNANISHWSVG